MNRVPRQLALPLPRPERKPRHGGPRVGAGRPPRSGERAHVRRARFDGSREPVHVTVRFARHVWNLRSQRGFACVQRALRFEAQRGEVRIVHFSVQGNHLHMVVEAADQPTLSRRMQGFGIRLARALNAMMGRHGRVYGDRYHAHVLRTPREARNAIAYVLENHARHAARARRDAPAQDRYASSWLVAHPPAFVSATGPPTPLVLDPETWLLRRGHGRAR